MGQSMGNAGGRGPMSMPPLQRGGIGGGIPWGGGAPWAQQRQQPQQPTQPGMSQPPPGAMQPPQMGGQPAPNQIRDISNPYTGPQVSSGPPQSDFGMPGGSGGTYTPPGAPPFAGAPPQMNTMELTRPTPPGTPPRGALGGAPMTANTMMAQVPPGQLPPGMGSPVGPPGTPSSQQAMLAQMLRGR